MRFQSINSMPPGVLAAVEKKLGITAEREAKYKAEQLKAEKILQRDTQNLLTCLDIFWTHLIKDVKRYPGHPDFPVFVINGHAVAVELKSEDGTFEDGQEEKLVQLARNGCDCWVIRTFEDFVDMVNYYKRLPGKRSINLDEHNRIKGFEWGKVL